MPEIQTQYIKIRSNGIFASIEIPRSTNLGPGFLKIRKTGDPKIDFVETKLGKFINHSKNPNLFIKISRWKYYLFTSRIILKGEELTLDHTMFPWKKIGQIKKRKIYEMKTIKGCLNNILKNLLDDQLNEQKVKIPVEEPGKLEVPEGKNVEDLPESHFQDLIKKKGWVEISKALINLKVWNKTKNKELSDWADKMQEKLAAWVEKQREAGKKLD